MCFFTLEFRNTSLAVDGVPISFAVATHVCSGLGAKHDSPALHLSLCQCVCVCARLVCAQVGLQPGLHIQQGLDPVDLAQDTFHWLAERLK